jgi:hypothetical protein
MRCIELQRQFNNQKYQKNIQALRAGTALESGEFVQLMRERAQQEFKANFALIVDPTIYDMSDIEDRVVTQKDSEGQPIHQYTQNTYKTLQEDLTKQYEHLTDEQAEYNDNSIVFKAHLKTEQENYGLSYILDNIIDDSASANYFKVQDQHITAIVPQMSFKSSLEAVCDKTGWDTKDIKFTSFNESIDDLSTLDHEMGHAFLYKHLDGQDPLAHLDDSEYSSYIHECVANTVSVFSAIHDGHGKEYFDILCLERAYGALCHMDTEHFTNATLQHLKENIRVEHIQSMPDKKAVAEYALLRVLGNREQDIKPVFLSKESFEQQTNLIEILGDKINYHAEQNGLETLTPLQINELIKDDFFEEEETKFLNRYVTYHRDTFVHQTDVELELTSQERFDNPNLADEADYFFEPAYSQDVHGFEADIVQKIFPLDDEGNIISMPLEERLYILQRQERMLEHNKSLDDHKDVIHKYKDHLHKEMEFQEMRDEMKHTERSELYVEKDEHSMI